VTVDTSRKDLVTSAWGSLLQVHAAVVPALDRVVQEAAGLPLSWYDVLLELAAEPGRRLRMSDLGQRVVLSRSRVSRLVDEMCAAGLVAREDNPDDARSSLAVLTAEGLRRYRQAAPAYVAGIDATFASHLTDDELRVVAAALPKVLAATP
jgi:DNA-binding MarR family transcriptional regulator